jgi:hypothetical protein
MESLDTEQMAHKPAAEEIRAQYLACGLDPDFGRLTGADLLAQGLSLRRYKHCGPYVVELELLPESVTNEGRAAGGAPMPGAPSKRPDLEFGSYRADRARVVAITHVLTGAPAASARSGHDGSFTYRPGETVLADNYLHVYSEQCCEGIHYVRTLGGVYGRMLHRGVVSASALKSVVAPGTRARWYGSDDGLLLSHDF